MRETTSQQSVVPRRRRWVRTALAAAVALICAISTAFAAITIPPAPGGEYSFPILAPGSQGFGNLNFAWQNVAPNALDSYYTYIPLSHADAVALGMNDYTGVDPLNPANTAFVHSCGNKAIAGSAPDQASTNDCYVITVKRFNQGLSLPLAWGFGGPGLVDSLGNPTVTDVYGYGSGGRNWTPPQFVYDALSPTGIRPKTAGDPGGLATIQGNAPTPFFNGAPGTNGAGAVLDGIWHFPAPTIKGIKGRSVRVQWLNELPNLPIPGFDPTVDCSDSAPDCFPFNRIVTHVHGAHVGPESDGLAHAGYNPDFSNIGTKFNLSVPADPVVKANNPPGTYIYPMDQEASTIWYHDHAVGTTHLNTNQGMAGFFPITDENETCLQTTGTVAGTPCTKVLPTGAYELGFALQDRIFDVNGQFAMPDAPVVDANFPTCDPTDAGTRMATCSPLFMKVAHAADANSLTPAGTHLVPYDEATITDFGPGGINADAPFLGVSATLEFFGNMPVVNGAVYAKYDVEPRVYRMRFIGGTDSRTWVLQLQNRAANNAPIPFYQIGSEQGFLNAPTARNEILLMPGERVDVLVDFSAFTTPGTKIVLANLGTDAPFQGEPIAAMVRSADIPEIMEFNTVAFNNAVADVPSPALISTLRPIGGAIAPLVPTAGLPIRKVALEEIVDEYGRIMPTIDRRGYDLPGMPATEIIHLNDTEQWDIINTTADAHPMHLHLVAFQVVHRQAFDPLTFVPAVNDIVNNIFVQPSYSPLVTLGVTSAPVPPDPHDAGWKDTVYSPPGFVTRVIAKFDKTGEYVWHCHILSHEEHDMMRPMKVVDLAANPPASVTVPVSSIGLNATVVVTPPATQVANAGIKYMIEYKLATATEWITNISTSPAAIITFPGYGVYNVRAKIVDATMSPTVADSPYTAAANTISVDPLDSIVSPVNGATLAGTSQRFVLSSASTSDVLWIGSAVGKADIGRFIVPAGQFTVTATGLPANGLPVYVRLWVKGSKVDPADPARILTVWNFKDYSYVAASPSVAPNTPVLNGPSGSVNVLSPAYSWGAVAGATDYDIFRDVNGVQSLVSFTSSVCTAGTCTVTQTPALVDGDSVYWIVRAKNSSGVSAWSSSLRFTVVTAVSAPAAPVISGPSGISANTSPVFTWGAVAGATGYDIFKSINGTLSLTTYTSSVCTAGTCSVTQTPALLDGDNVYFVVRAKNSAGMSAWSASSTFAVTTAVVPAVPSLVSPSVTSTVLPTYVWSDVAGATNYDMFLDVNGVQSIVPYTTAGNCNGTTCSVTAVTPLSAGSNVYWIVRARNVAGMSAWSAPLTFQAN